MTHNRPLKVRWLAAAHTLALASVATVAIPASAQPPPLPVIATGQAVAFHAGARVFASALPDEAYLNSMKTGDSFRRVSVATGTVDRSGNFALRADVQALPEQYRGPDGQVDLEITVTDGASSGQTIMSTFLKPTREKRTGTALVRAAATSRGSAATAPQPVSASYLTCVTTLIQRNILRKAEIGDSATPDLRQSSFMTYTSSQAVSLGIAVDMSNDSIGWKTAGTVTRSSGFTAAWAESTANRGYTLESEIGYYKDVCYIVSSGVSSYAYTRYSYQPIRLTGGYSQVSGTTLFAVSSARCTSPIAAGYWTRNSSNGSAWTLTTGFDISGLVGFDVTSTSNWDTYNALTYHQPTNYTYKLCGNNDYPAFASRIHGKFA